MAFTPDEIIQGMMANLRMLFEHDIEGATVPVDEKERDHVVVWAFPGVPYQPDDLAFAEELAIGEFEPKAGQEDAGEDISAIPANLADTLSPGGRLRLRLRQARVFSELVDFLPTRDLIYPGMGVSPPLSTIMDVVLNHSQIAKLPKADSEAVKVVLNQAQAILDDKEKEEQYKIRKKEYRDALDALTVARITFETSESTAATLAAQAKLKPLHEDLMDAIMSWNGRGFREEIENAKAHIASAAKEDLVQWRDRVKQKYDGATAISVEASVFNEFKYTSLFPTKFLNSNNGWTNYSYSESQQARSFGKKITRFGGEVSVLGYFRSSANDRREKVNITSKSEQFSISMRVAEVAISRPWLDSIFLESHAWRFGPGAGSVFNVFELSDGERPPTGSMIGYSTSIIFAKDIVIETSDMLTNSDTYKTEFAAGGGLSLGPISLGIGGSGSSQSQTTDVSFKFENGRLTVEGMQVIGFRCRLLNKAPDPLEESNGIVFI